MCCAPLIALPTCKCSIWPFVANALEAQVTSTHSKQRVRVTRLVEHGARRGGHGQPGPQAGELLMEEYVVQKGLKPDIQSLSTELLAMHPALLDASQVPPDQLSEVDKLWSRKVRELSYDMNDAIDDFAIRVASSDSTATTDANVFKKILSKPTAAVRKAKNRQQISDKIKDIKKLSNELAELRAKYIVKGVGANLAATTSIDPRVINLYKKESDLVSIEETRDKVIRMLTGVKGDADAFESLKTVSIVGVGGLGKTTLVKTVLDALKSQFHCCAFISVGRTPNYTKKFEKMLVELDEKYSNSPVMAGWDSKRFCNELHKLLQNKRGRPAVEYDYDGVDSRKVSGDLSPTPHQFTSSSPHQSPSRDYVSSKRPMLLQYLLQVVNQYFSSGSTVGSLPSLTIDKPLAFGAPTADSIIHTYFPREAELIGLSEGIGWEGREQYDQIKLFKVTASIRRTFCCPASRYFSMSKKEQWAQEVASDGQGRGSADTNSSNKQLKKLRRAGEVVEWAQAPRPMADVPEQR
ncbi:hypothetical protein EJB05_26133, partial [Eragrostis curvula]